MSLLLSCQAIRKQYGAQALFEDLSLGIAAGDHIGLVGPNGSGKSTLLKILAGVETADGGTRSVRKHLRLGYVPQATSFAAQQTIEDIVTQALDGERVDIDDKHVRAGTALAKVGFPDVQQRAADLSGGWTKRLAIACALVREPDLLLLDEPTNHLDLEGILWLEKLLRADPAAFLVVSHDRYFLENVANRVIELNRMYPAGVFDVRGTYSEFLEKKDEALHEQARYQETLANRVRNELEWLKRGPKARTRKSGARIDEAGRLQEELCTLNRRLADGTVRLAFSATERKTKRLLVAAGISKTLGGRPILSGLDLTLSPRMRLGVLGPNGSGKTTLLRLLSGDLDPDSGRIERADGLRIVYLDQHREHIEPGTTLRRALAPHGDQVVYGDRPIHVAGWAKRFLFQGEQLDQPVANLSGGERARVAIARLLLRPADLLILDEPTNDLDIPTLEVLEESLLEFPGALVLVTHDRFLFDRVATVVLALDGAGGAQAFADYAQWEDAQREGRAVTRGDAPRTTAAKPVTGRKRLSYHEQREWEQMEATILAAEDALGAATAAANDPAIAADASALRERYAALEAARAEVDRLYARWAALEAKQSTGATDLLAAEHRSPHERPT